MFSVADKTMLVTGGSRGMGKLFCGLGVAEGAKIIIWDINEQAMEETARELTRGGEVYTYKVDVSDRGAIEKAAQLVLEKHGTVDILINNAGIVVASYFWEHTNDQIEKTMRVNSEGPMYICRAFLPAMIKKREGRIVNMASAAGLISNPKMSVYCASKWAVTGWSELAAPRARTTGLPQYLRDHGHAELRRHRHVQRGQGAAADANPQTRAACAEGLEVHEERQGRGPRTLDRSAGRHDERSAPDPPVRPHRWQRLRCL